MAITYRDEKGSPLSAPEVDENFRTLVQMINDSAGEQGVSVTDITQAADTITIHMSDGSTHGPFTLPVAAFNDTGTWQPEFDYAMLDLFEVPNIGLYLVLIPHTSGAEFDPDISDSEGSPMLRLLLRTAGGPQTIITTQEDPGDIQVEPSEVRNSIQRIPSTFPVNLFVRDDGTLDGSGAPRFEIGDMVVYRQMGVGQLTIVPDGDTIIHTPETLSSRKQGSTIVLTYVGNSEYDLSGDLELISETTGP
jgi:hypothetical protein